MIRLGLVIFFCLGRVIISSAQIADCQLSRLDISCGILSPYFQPDKKSYFLTLSSTTSLNEIQLTPVADCTGCAIQINGQNVASNSIWSLADGKKKIRIEIINREKKLNSYYYVFINQITPALFADDSLKLENVKVIYGYKRPKWLDKNGYLYATSRDTIFKSIDQGRSWDPVYVVPRSLGGNEPLPTLIVSETGRIIFCSNGNVLVSDENQKNFTTKYTFQEGGSPAEHLAHSMYDSIILLGSYEYRNDSAEAAMSTDYGRSWRKIFTIPNFLKSRLHIHDIVFDRFSKRIFIATGDARNAQIYYSDNWGNTWEKIFKRSITGNLYQTTQIIPLQHGIVLGSDGPKDGLMYLPKIRAEDKDILLERMRVKSDNFVKIDNDKLLKRFAVRRWEMKRGNKTLFLLPYLHCVYPFQKTGNDYTRLWSSYNGIEWYELYKWKGDDATQIFGFENIMGPSQEDKNNTVFATFSGEFFKANIQFPKKLVSPKLLAPIANAPPLLEPVFEWSRIKHVLNYHLQISQDEKFSRLILNDSSLVGNSYYFDKLLPLEKYYWRIKAIGFAGESDWSEGQQFFTANDLNASDVKKSEEPILYQNTPNPFISSTKVLYYIPEKSEVQFVVYNSIGKQMSVEISTKEAGIFTKEINFETLNSRGMYFAELRVTFLNSGISHKKAIKLLFSETGEEY